MLVCLGDVQAMRSLPLVHSALPLRHAQASLVVARSSASEFCTTTNSGDDIPSMINETNTPVAMPCRRPIQLLHRASGGRGSVRAGPQVQRTHFWPHALLKTTDIRLATRFDRKTPVLLVLHGQLLEVGTIVLGASADGSLPRAYPDPAYSSLHQKSRD